ncbi:DoxX family protein [bacterium]|nr:DoxX family protein [bacterium]
MKSTPGFLEAIARLFISSVYIYFAIKMLVYSRLCMEHMLEAGVPAIPLVYVVTLSTLLIGSLGLFLGYRTKSAALMLIFISIPAILFIYPPWDVSEFSQFLAHLGLVGGLIHIYIYGPGKYTFDARNMVPVKRRRT